MNKERTIEIIINTLEQFKVKLEYISYKIKNGKVGFKFKISNKVNALKTLNYADDIRLRLACRDKVKMIVIDDETIGVILPEEFGEEKRIVMEEISENDTDDNRIDTAIKDIKKDLKDGKTADMLTLMKALDSKYDKLDRQNKKIEEDERYVEALEYLIGKEETSISDIQRHFGFGFARAASFIDDFESKGYISSCNGSKKRKVNITEEEFNAKYKK